MTDPTSLLRAPLTPYFHPTTVVFIDDNESYLRSLDLELPLGWSYKCFTDPFEGFEYLQQPPAIEPLADRCFSFENVAPLSATVHMDVSTIEQEVNLIQRFERNSVAIVDYSMPAFNGLDLCAQITDPHIRKALLTGVADEKVAVEAFNDGIIHKFVTKQAVESLSNLMRFVGDMQVDYFYHCVARLTNTLAVNPPGFLTESAVQTQALQVMHELRAVEYYLVNEPQGFLLARADGAMFRLVIYSEQEMVEHLAALRRWEAPRRICARVEAREGMVLLTESPDDYHGGDAFPWDENFLHAAVVPGTDYYIGVMDDPPRDIDFDPTATSYNAYLEQCGRRPIPIQETGESQSPLPDLPDG